MTVFKNATFKRIVHYAGIGSRKVPVDILAAMQRIAYQLAGRRFVLRSGAAHGADSAFEDGCDRALGKKEIWVPWFGYNDHFQDSMLPADTHFEAAMPLHPVWESLAPAVKALHARNVGQILGATLRQPVDFVVCWTPDGCSDEQTRTSKTGGTGTAIVCASQQGIPVFNLKNPGTLRELSVWINSTYGPRLE